ncbi:hypothetical protein PTKIN_Ptkin17bG0141200 [Pterospermum kingtungense]
METRETKLGGKDVDMLVDEDEGKLVAGNNSTDYKGKSGVVAGVNPKNRGCQSGNKKLQVKKKNMKKRGDSCQSGKEKLQVNKKNMKKKGDSGPKAFDRDIFVMRTCSRLREKKAHMVYIAAGCLGVCALNDLVEEVLATRGQKTADGRYQPCGGILWDLIKTRKPAAYGEIMKKTRDFEKTACMPDHSQTTLRNLQDLFTTACILTNETSATVPECSQTTPRNLQEQFSSVGTR